MAANEPESNLVTCRCNTCDGYLEFKREHAGDRVNCPHCGIETLLYIPTAPVGILAPPQEPPPRVLRAGLTRKARVGIPVPPPPPPPPAFGAADRGVMAGIPVPPPPPPPPSGIELFYYKIGDSDTEKGPYTFEQLNSLWNNGRITADTLYRSEQSPAWALLSVRIGQQSASSFLPLTKLNDLLLKCFCVFSLIAFFLPNAVISVPIFGSIGVSMFDFLTPRFDKKTGTGEEPEKPNIKVIEDFQIKKATIGGIVCALSVVGILLHYALSLVWGVTAFALKRTFSIFNIAWLSLALQFPILFSVGAHVATAAMKATALSDAANDAGDNSPGAALGTALGAAFVNRISVQPGAVMWVLMAFALIGLSLPRLARRFRTTV